MAVNINVPSQVKTYTDLAAFPASGALKTIYIAEDTNKTYRWTGSVYVEVSAAGASGITIGTTAITSGAVGRVLFEGTGNVVQQSSSLFWDSTNDRLTIGTSTGTSKINLPDAGTTASDGIAFGNGAWLFKNASTGISLFSGSGTWQFNSAMLVLPTNQATFIRMNSGRNLSIDNGTTTFASINGTTGNVGINTTTDAGYKLDVNGTARVKGSGTTSATTSLLIQNSAGVNLLQVRDDNLLTYASALTLSQTGTRTTFSTSGGTNVNHFRFTTLSSLSSPTGNTVFLDYIASFTPTSGVGTFSALSYTGVINQTGGASGITRGLYINPTLTAAADFRAIETTAGSVIFGGLPTSSAGLPTGAIWNDAGTLKIV